MARGHHGARVALHHVRQARVAQEDPVRLLVEPALLHDAYGGDEDALVVDLRRVGRDAARAQASDVLVVTEGGGEGDDRALVEHGDDEDHVLMVLDRAVGQVRVVEPVDVARAHALQRIRFQDGGEHAGAARRDVAGHDAAGPVVEPDEVVLLLLDEGRHRAALHQLFHLADRRCQRAAYDLERDGIDHRRSRMISSE